MVCIQQIQQIIYIDTDKAKPAASQGRKATGLTR